MVSPTSDLNSPELASSGRRGLLTRVLPALVLVTLLGAAAAVFFVARTTVHDQERRLLEERTSEVGLILNTAFATVTAQLHSLGTAARLGDSRFEEFLEEAETVRSAAANPPAIALVRREAGRLVVVAATGKGLERGSALSGARKSAVERALSSKELATTRVFREGSRAFLGLVLGPPATSPGTAVYREAPLAPPGASGGQPPFQDLNLVLYATPEVDPDQLVLSTTAALPLRGDSARQELKVGAESWLLVISAREPLVGSFAITVPWIVLGVVLFGAFLATAVTLVLVRRRNYAYALADERTVALKSSLRELERAQERLVLQERLAAIGQVAAAVGHELRNPLGVLTNALYLIRTGLPGAQEQGQGVTKHLDTAEREIAAAVVIVESLLDFARARTPATVPVDLVELIEETLSVAPPPTGVEVVRMGLEELPAVLADRQQLRQVLLNLVTNGYEAINGEGVLTIEAGAQGADVQISISDTGPGMDEATAAHVFEPFFTGKAKGIGLGLAVTQRIVEAHGGTIGVESVPGQGAVFSFTLPGAPVAEEALR